MRIAFVTETWWPATDGVVTRITATVRELKAMGHELLIIAPRGGAATFEGIPVRDVPNISVGFIYGGKPWGLPLPRVKGYLEEFQPDVIHVVNPFVLGVAGVLSGTRLKIPIVASYHTNIAGYADFYHLGFTKPLIWAILRALHNRAHLNLATSETMKRVLESEGIQRVSVWRRGVDLDLFNPKHRSEKMRHRLTDGHPDRLIALYVGRIALEKGLNRLHGLFDHNPHLHLSLVGTGPAEGILRDQFKETPTSFVGKLLGADLASAYASADFFIFPSTTETLGLVLLEAMASGLPIVAAESLPTHELVDESGAGALFSPDHPEHIGRIIENFFAGNSLETLKHYARNEAERWGWSLPTRELVGWYHQASNQRQRGLA